ncbi:FAD-dependent oxidoreductase [Microbacterium sp. STN6]|uniref:FAD-dependent oxidoreductase n=1 Tax=Microbacterium sp. STN6 TaxID=2995588 RepID=UPI002260AC5D|nr:FAD-dependent oxidoreductase [Microbacterium sp. STN6]MCX7522847.1 FAD-dependent oxidoreductase [Microbacterium sp. STN6]
MTAAPSEMATVATETSAMHTETARYEVVVYGATSAGVCAAVAAAGEGAQVLLIGPERHVGGMTSGGLGYTDVGDERALGGPARRLRHAVAEHYGVAEGHFAGPEPHVAEAIFVRWLEEAGVEVRLGERAGVAAAQGSGGGIRSLGFESGLRVSAGVFIDASYEGDLLPLAGVEYSVGRESTALHGERFAGRQELVPGRHTMPAWISPFASDPSGESEGPLLAQIKPEPMVPVGAGDGGVMSYGYRVCLTTAPDRIAFERPADYDDGYWELGRRLLAQYGDDEIAYTAGRMLGLEPNLPGGKSDGNSLGPLSLSVLDGSAWRYPDADAAERERIRLHHLSHTAGFLYFLATDAAVPRRIRETMQRFGLPRDEFADTGHLPHQLYVREGRRMQGAYVLTEHDLIEGRHPRDSVALGSYHLDIREVQRAWRWVYEHPRPIGMVFTEGYLSVQVPLYGVPYRSLTPRAEQCDNLLVPVCLSASHVAFSSVRMEPQYQMLGHAAGIAAAQAVAASVPVQAVSMERLHERLDATGQVFAL